jgi:hypothetical protein
MDELALVLSLRNKGVLSAETQTTSVPALI